MPKSMTPQIENLFIDFTEQRNQLKIMIGELEQVKTKVGSLFPEQLTARNKFFLDEKIKTASSLFYSLLEIRKEIIKSIKDEIELRRRFEMEERELEETDDDIRRLASKIEQISGVKYAVIDAFKEKQELLSPDPSVKQPELVPNLDNEPPESDRVKLKHSLESEGYVRLDELQALGKDKKEKEVGEN